MASGATIALSSGPPVESRPATLRARQLACAPALTSSVSPILTPSLFASAAPTTHSSEFSANQLPSTCHHGLVFSIPVMYVVPSGMGTECCDQVPISVAWSDAPGLLQFVEAGDHT